MTTMALICVLVRTGYGGMETVMFWVKLRGRAERIEIKEAVRIEEKSLGYVLFDEKGNEVKRFTRNEVIAYGKV